MEKYNIEELLKDRKLKWIFTNSNYVEVYDAIDLYVMNFEKDRTIANKLRNLLFIEYLKTLKIRKNSNFYERLLAVFINFNNNSEIINYLLKQELNISYNVQINDNVKVPLGYLLAIKIKDKENMKLLLEKHINKRYLYIENGNFNEATDLVRMNIIAGNITLALNYFNSNNYKLINDTNIELSNPANYLKINKKIIINGFNYQYDDRLYQLLLTIKASQIDLISKRNLLITILNSNKINLFNTLNLTIIEYILDSETYNKFLDYLRKKELNKEIVLYNQSLNHELNYIKLDDILGKKNIVRK